MFHFRCDPVFIVCSFTCISSPPPFDHLKWMCMQCNAIKYYLQIHTQIIYIFTFRRCNFQTVAHFLVLKWNQIIQCTIVIGIMCALILLHTINIVFSSFFASKVCYACVSETFRMCRNSKSGTVIWNTYMHYEELSLIKRVHCTMHNAQYMPLILVLYA